MSENIEAIFFDMNGTLRTRELSPSARPAAFTRIADILGRDDAADVDWEDLSRRYDAYGAWAQGKQIQLSESEIWTRWLLPDEPPEQVAAHADELMLAWMERKGLAVPKPGAQAILQELQQRGYRLGIISNTMSTLDLPRFIEAVGWNRYFEIVILSSVYKSRKPAPDLFDKAAQSLHLDPARCAYVGNRVSKDIVGCKQAGYSLGILLGSPGIGLGSPGSPHLPEPDPALEPDVTIHSLDELLDIFTPKPVRSA